MQYMMDLNECRTEISKIDIENLIEDEFVSLDDYIFKVKWYWLYIGSTIILIYMHVQSIIVTHTLLISAM